MRLSYLGYAFEIILRYFGFIILIPIVFSLIYGEYTSIIPFLTTSLISIVMSLLFKFSLKNVDIKNLNDIKKGEALFIVAASWVLAGIISSLPYLFYGMNIIDALFESASGITTTGASICSGMNYPHSILFWRSLTQWLGGMGIIVLFIAILPQFAVAGRQMFFAELPGPTEEKFTPRIRSTASSLWKIYALLTLIECIILIFAGMPVFDSITNSLSTLSAGGFSPNKYSIMGYNSNLIIWIVMFFIFLSGVNFNLQYKALTKFNIKELFKSEEFRAYLLIFLGISALVTSSMIINDKFTFLYSITHSMFQTISLMTSTGSSSADYTQWHFTTKVILFLAVFTGGCASSASGGIKIARWVLIWKIMKNAIKKILHQNAVLTVKVDNNIIGKDIISQTVMFVFFYIALIVVSIIIIGILEQNATVGISGSISSIGNIGPGFDSIIGPMKSYETLHPISKIILILDMYVGRLELIPFLVMFERDFWIIKLK